MSDDLKLKDDHWCFACGTDNPHGLRLEDIHLHDDECVCTFVPRRWHQGWANILHGGITSTLLDEVMTHLIYRLGYDAVTAEMTIRLKEQIPIGGRLEVRSRLTRHRRRFMETEGVLLLENGEEAATSTGKFFISDRGADTPDSPIITLSQRKAVIFDMFGTLIPVYPRDEHIAVMARVADALGVDSETFSRVFTEARPERFMGATPSMLDHLRDLARRAGGNPDEGQVKKALEIRREYTMAHLTDPFPDALETLRALKDAGRPMALLSDCSPEAAELWDDTPLAEFFDAPVLSCKVGMTKPAPEIFLLACERAGVSPWNAVYVGDGDSQELPGAAAVGLCPILVERPGQHIFHLDGCTDCEMVVSDLTRILPLVRVESAGE